MTALLEVRDLAIQAGQTPLLKPLSFRLAAGECLALVGESGAGKSLLAEAIMAALPAGLKASGQVALGGQATAAEDARARRGAWGRRVAMLPQEPWLALDGSMRILGQLAEVHALVGGRSGAWAAAEQVARAQLQVLDLAKAERLYPWQISGGMAQRVAFAAAMAGGAPVLLVDEPTKGLDSRLREQVRRQLADACAAGGAVVLITHDLALAAELGSRVIVLRDGDVIEQGQARAVLGQPQHAYTRELIGADPARWPASAAPDRGPRVLSARGLVKRYGDRAVVNQTSLDLHRGDRVALRGDSGAGKTTLGNLLVGVLAADSGEIVLGDGVQRRDLQKLYQDPAAAFAPKASLATSLKDLCRLRGIAWSRVQQGLDDLQLPASLLDRWPQAVSGGELQRLALLRAMLCEPALLFADEPTSRLDPVTQRRTIEVMLQVQRQQGFALLFVTHDDALGRHVAPRETLVVEGDGSGH